MANQSKFQDSSSEKSGKKCCYRCVMPGCNYYAPNGFFTWPKKDYLKKKWEQICGLENVSQNAKLCLSHFDPEHYIKKTNLT